MVGLVGTVSHVWRRPCVCLSVVVPTPRLVCVLCALSAVFFMSLRCYPVLLDSGLVFFLNVAQAVVLVGRTYWAIVGCCCDELHYISPYVTGYVLYYCTVATC